jgi:hypothetical protein
MTLWGAGVGQTVLHTESNFNTTTHERGHGIDVPGNYTMQHNVTLRDFELTSDTVGPAVMVGSETNQTVGILPTKESSSVETLF